MSDHVTFARLGSDGSFFVERCGEIALEFHRYGNEVVIAADNGRGQPLPIIVGLSIAEAEELVKRLSRLVRYMREAEGTDVDAV